MADDGTSTMQALDDRHLGPCIGSSVVRGSASPRTAGWSRSWTRARIIRLVEAETGRVIARLESPDSPDVIWATFSPDGSRLVLVPNNNPAVHVWDLRAIRKRLAAMGLDWDAPAYSDDDPAAASVPPLPPLQVDLGPLPGEIEHLTPSQVPSRATPGDSRTIPTTPSLPPSRSIFALSNCDAFRRRLTTSPSPFACARTTLTRESSGIVLQP